MTKKPKTANGKTVGRNAVTGKFATKKSSAFGYVERIPRAGGSHDVYTTKGSAVRVVSSATSKTITSSPKSPTSSPVEYEPKLAQPLEHRADPRAFATELLSSDKIVMDILSK